MRGYSEPERDLICAAFAKAAGRALSDTDKSHLLVKLDDDAMRFQGLKRAMTNFPIPSKRREQLDALDKTIRRLKLAFAKTHPTVWHSISTRTELPEGPDRAIHQMLLDQTYDGEMFSSHFGLEALHSGVCAALAELDGRKKTGPKSNDPLHWFILRVADIYYEITEEEPKAHYREVKGKGIRTGQFVRCLEECLRPIDPSSVKDSLGDVAYKLLEKRKRNPHPTQEQSELGRN